MVPYFCPQLIRRRWKTVTSTYPHHTPVQVEEKGSISSAAGPSNRAMLQDGNKAERIESSEVTPISRGVRATGDGDGRHSPDPTSSGSSGSERSTGGDGGDSTKPKTTRTRTVKSRDIFTPEDDTEKKVKGKGKGKGRRIKCVSQKRDLKNLLEDEKTDVPGSADGKGGRRRCRNESDGENRWDRIRAKVKGFLQKIRRDSHYLEVYQHDGWKSSGREKLKPTVELQKAKERVKGVKAELRQVVKRLTEMNPDGSRWRNLKQDNEGNIKVDEVVCSKCNKGDSDDNDDILLCDYAGCFRAFHQNCLSPPIKPEAFPSPSEDWFCWQCECLTDCLQLIEDEVPGSKLRTWEDVFPDVEAGEGQASGKNQDLLLIDSDDSDDESFKGSSSESGNEEAVEWLSQEPGGNSPGKSSPGSKGMEGSSDEDIVVDDVWMSDAESVGSDEVTKLQTEAADMETEEVGKGDSRASRALARRKLRNKALGLPDDSASTRAHVADLVREEKVDTSNIMHGRRARKPVDYAKLNEALFGNEEVYGDIESSDPQRREKSEGNGSDEYEDSDPCEDSDASIERYRPRRKSTSFTDPLIGEPQKKGRPRKSFGGGVAAGQPNRKLGRARKSPGPAVAENLSERVRGDASNEASLENGAGSAEQSRGRPIKTMVKPETTSEKDSEDMGIERGTPVTLEVMTAPPTSLEDVTNGEAGDSAEERSPSPPTHASEAKEGATSFTEKRGSSRHRKDDAAPGSSNTDEGGRAVAKTEPNGSPQPIQEGTPQEGSSRTTEKRKRGRPRKYAAAPGSARGGVGIGSAFCGGGDCTMGSSQQIGAPEGVSNTTGKRKRGRPRKDGATPGSARGGVGIASRSDANGGAGSIVPKRKAGRPRKVGKDVMTPSTSRGDVGADGAGISTEKKCAFVQSGSAESTKDGIQLGAKGADGSMVPKRKAGRPRKDRKYVTTPGTLRGGVGTDSMPTVPKFEEPATVPIPQDVGRRETIETATKRGRGRPRKVGMTPISPHEAFGASSRSAKGASSLAEKSELGHPGIRKALSNTQPKDGVRGSVKTGVLSKPSSPRDEEMRKALRQFIAEDATSPPGDKFVWSSRRVNPSKNNSKSSSEKRKRGRPRKHVASSNDQPGSVAQGDHSNIGKIKPAGPATKDAGNNKGKPKLGRPRENGALSDILPRNAPEGGSSSSFVKRKVCRISKYEASPGTQRNDAADEGKGSNAGKRKAGPSQETEVASGSQEGLDANGATIDVGTLKVGLSQETETSLAPPPQHCPDRNVSTIDGGKRKAGPPQETEASSASLPQEGFHRNGSTIDAGTLKVGLSQETGASSTPPSQEGLDGNGAAIDGGKRKAGPQQETEALSAASQQEGLDRNGATIDDDKGKAGPSRATETASAPTPQQGVDGNGQTIDVAKRKGSNLGTRKAGLPQEAEALSLPPPHEGLDSGATINSGKRKAGGVRKEIRSPDETEEGGALSGVVESQLGPTGKVAKSTDAPQAHVAGHLADMNAGGKSMSGLPRKEASMSDGSSSAQEIPTKRRGRGRPRKEDVAVASKRSANESRASIRKKQRNACGDSDMAVPAASVSDDPCLSPSSWTLNDGHAEPSTASNATASGIKVESTCPSEDELSDSADRAESSSSVAPPDDSNNGRAVAYIFTPTGRKAVLKKGRED